MRTWRLAGLAVTVVLALTASGCFGPATPEAAPPPPTPPLTLPRALPLPPPDEYPSYPVGLRRLDLHRGRNRPLPTLVFYPATWSPQSDLPALPAAFEADAKARTGTGRNKRTKAAARRLAIATLESRSGARIGSAPAGGRFPLVLFCHGLSGSAERYAATLAALASAGFVVAAPTFPNTSEFTVDFRRSDIVNQPADARYVLNRVERLNLTPGDPLRHRIDTDHIAAIGHSAGGYTTTGLLTAGHDPHLRSAVIMAGWAAKGAFHGTPATMLFLQGTADPIVPVAVSRGVYARVPWPKSYLLMRRNSHATYLRPGDLGYATMRSTVTDFLRWTLLGDEEAHQRLPRTVYPSSRRPAAQ